MEKNDQHYVLSRESFDAVIFDLDGVVTDTASLHAEAWKRAFDTFLKSRAGRDNAGWVPFDIATDYRDYVDGRPRYDGVRLFLSSRGITLPEGSVDDCPGNGTVHALGNRKNALFRQLLADQGAVPIRSTIAFIHGLRSRGFRVAMVSSSRNASTILHSAGIADLFDVTLDGVDTERLGLAEKPDPAVFLEAARRLGISPERAAVVEDAVAGVRAGSDGRFGCTIGLARLADRTTLQRASADVAVASLSEIQLDDEDETGRVPIATLPSAMECISEIVGAARHRSLVVFLDYDGTLTPIVSRPDLAILPAETRGVIKQLLSCATVVIVSGRDIDNVRALVDVEGITYAGDHGLRIATSSGHEVCSEHGASFRPVLEQVHGDLAATLVDIPGVILEPKFASLAVHYRLVADTEVAQVEAAIDHAVASHPGLRKTLGKKVFEIQPDIDWDKGKALLWLIDSMGITAKDCVVIYIGDDLTDEDAFSVLPSQGVGIVVRDGETRPTAAQYQLADPDAVRAFLSRLADLAPGSS